MILKNNIKAFTLVEIVIAVMVVGCAFIPIINLFQFGTSGTSNNINEIMAMNYASDLVNCMRVIPFSSMSSIVGDKKNFECNGYEELKNTFKDVMAMPRPQEETETDKLYPVKVSISYYSGNKMGWLTKIWHFGKKVLLKKDPDTVSSYLIKVSVAYPKGDMVTPQKIAASLENNKNGKNRNHVVLYSMLIEQ